MGQNQIIPARCTYRPKPHHTARNQGFLDLGIISNPSTGCPWDSTGSPRGGSVRLARRRRHRVRVRPTMIAAVVDRPSTGTAGTRLWCGFVRLGRGGLPTRVDRRVLDDSPTVGPTARRHAVRGTVRPAAANGGGAGLTRLPPLRRPDGARGAFRGRPAERRLDGLRLGDCSSESTPSDSGPSGLSFGCGRPRFDARGWSVGLAARCSVAPSARGLIGRAPLACSFVGRPVRVPVERGSGGLSTDGSAPRLVRWYLRWNPLDGVDGALTGVLGAA